MTLTAETRIIHFVQYSFNSNNVLGNFQGTLFKYKDTSYTRIFKVELERWRAQQVTLSDGGVVRQREFETAYKVEKGLER